MSVTVWIPRDAGALSLGAEAVVRKLQAEAQAAGEKIAIRRNGSRGLYWLEPLVEVETPAGRIAYGPVTERDVPDLVAKGLLKGAAHALRVGPIEEHPWFASQQRLTFARVGRIDPLDLAAYRASAATWASPARSNSGPTPRSTKSWSRACAAAAARHSRPASSGRPCCASRRARSTSPAMPTKATRVPTPTACSWKATRSR